MNDGTNRIESKSGRPGQHHFSAEKTKCVYNLETSSIVLKEVRISLFYCFHTGVNRAMHLLKTFHGAPSLRCQIQLSFPASKWLGRFFLGFILVVLFGIVPAEATHFMGGSLTWKRVDTNTVEFRLINNFKRSEFQNFGTGSDGFPVVGDTIPEVVGGTRLFFGDDTFTEILRYKVIAMDTVSFEWLECAALDSNNSEGILHTYPSEGNGLWEAQILSCCRIDSLQNVGANSDYRISALVNTDINSTPGVDSSFSYVVRLAEGGTRTFAIPLSQMEPDRKIIWRLASEQESGINNQPFIALLDPDAANLLSINANTGIISANTTGLEPGSLWAAQVIIVDSTDNILRTRVAVDFVIRITKNNLPQFRMVLGNTPVPCNLPILIKAGQNLQVTFEASDQDALAGGDTITMVIDESATSQTLIDDAVFDPTPPLRGNPVVSTLFWKPKLTDVGRHDLRFRATDITGSSSLCSVRLLVLKNQVPVFETPCDTTYTANVGQTITFPVIASDPDSGDIVAVRVVGQLPPGASMPPDSGNPAMTAFSWTPTVSDLGLHDISILAVELSGLKTTCSLTVLVQDSSDCSVEILSPQNEAFVCEDSLEVTAGIEIPSVGQPPFMISCDINGTVANVVDNMATATIPFSSDVTSIVTICVITDSTGNRFVCSDSIRVQSDDIAPDCSFTPQGATITGVLRDLESGISEIIPVNFRNAILTLDPFTPGAQEVAFRIDILDLNEALTFSLEAVDMCGNVFACDPVYFLLSSDASIRKIDLTFSKIDRYFQVINKELAHIRVNLNDHRFDLFSDSERARNAINAFPMPENGTITIDMLPYLRTDPNRLTVSFEGGNGSSADLLLIDAVDQVDYVLNLEPIPAAFQLAQNYPNPFNPSTTIQYAVPEKKDDAVPISIRIYNLTGELVRTLVDEEKTPGRYEVVWDGRNDLGESVASGIYLYQMTVGEFRTTHKMTLLK